MVFRQHLQWEALVECRILIRLAAFVIKEGLLVVGEEMQCLTIHYSCLNWMQINSIEEMGTERMVLAVAQKYNIILCSCMVRFSTAFSFCEISLYANSVLHYFLFEIFIVYFVSHSWVKKWCEFWQRCLSSYAKFYGGIVTRKHDWIDTSSWYEYREWSGVEKLPIHRES